MAHWWLGHDPGEGVGHEVTLRSCLQGCWRDVEAEVLRSLKDCQQQVSTLLADVHRQRYRPFPTRGPAPGHTSPEAPPLWPLYFRRLALLQTFERNVNSQLKHLQQTSAGLSSMNADILVLVQLVDTGPQHCPLLTLILSSRVGSTGRGSVLAPSVKTTSRGQSGPVQTGSDQCLDRSQTSTGSVIFRLKSLDGRSSTSRHPPDQ